MLFLEEEYVCVCVCVPELVCCTRLYFENADVSGCVELYF